MATTLPQATQLKVQQALGQWTHWQVTPPLDEAPVVLESLAGGRSNTSLLVGSGQQRFVLRVDGIDPRSLGINRATEFRAQRAASEQGLAPHPCYRNPDLGVMVSHYIEAESPPSKQQELAAIARLLHQIHQLPQVNTRLRIRDRANRYREQAVVAVAYSSGFEQACLRLEANTQDRRLCHNDLLAANRLWHEGQLIALDWEYAAMGDPFFDLAAVCEGDRLCDDDSLYLLDAYLSVAGAVPGASQRLQDNRLVYQELDRLWQRATGR